MNLKFVVGPVAVLAAVLVVNSAEAFTDVCTLSAQPLAPSDRLSAAAVASYKEKIASECALAEKFQQLKVKAQKQSVALEQITVFQALRTVPRANYEAAKAARTPIESVYPVGRDTQVPTKLEIEASRFSGGSRLDTVALQRLHAELYQSADSSVAQAAQPGVLKTAATVNTEWFKLSPDQAPTAKSIVNDINDDLVSLGFITGGLEALYDTDSYLTEMLSVKPAADGLGEAVYSSDPRSIEARLKALTAFLDEVVGQARRGQAMVWKDQLMTPGEVAYFAQQYVNDTRPFAQGSDRVSRYVQEIILTSFGLPPGASGDLMAREVLTRRQDYYAGAMAANRDLLASTDECIERVYARRTSDSAPVFERRSGSKSDGRRTSLAPVIEAPVATSADLEYNCRILR